jgi:hypothetical protein
MAPWARRHCGFFAGQKQRVQLQFKEEEEETMVLEHR